MDYLPLFFRLKGSPVLLVGGGKVALRKARLLTRAGARIKLVAPEVEGELETLLQQNQGSWIGAEYSAEYMDQVRLVVSATPSREVNEQVSRDASLHHLPVNVVDQPDLCTFIFPSIVDRSPLLVGVSSSGTSPVLARIVRARIEAMLPAALGKLAAFMGAARSRVKLAIPDERKRRLFWERLSEGPAAQLVLAGREQDAERHLDESLREEGGEHVTGAVYLVGAGPGDPDLLSFKAARLLQLADVVLYDRLVSPPILDMARKDAERIYVGKKRDRHSVPQGEINQMLVDLAREGHCVVRLKGGDPFIFGRGGEEIELLARHRIPFQVVPGVTAASGCACYAGIPLTHRDYAQSVRFVTGHLKEGELDLPWEELVGVGQTVVFYMGMGALELICEQLRAHGRDAGTPIALVEQGTTSNQRTLVGTLESLPRLVEQAAVSAPTLIIVGEVVRLRDQLGWFAENDNPGSWPAEPAR